MLFKCSQAYLQTKCTAVIHQARSAYHHFKSVEYVGHFMRGEKLENVVIIGKIEGKSGRLGPRLTHIRSLSK